MSDCQLSGHIWEAVDQYQIAEDKMSVTFKCFECDKEFSEIHNI